jgi:DNA-binding HxlR family transcriptional regulator
MEPGTEDGTSRCLAHPAVTIEEAEMTTDAAHRAGGRAASTQACELRDLLDRLADKWSLLAVELLGGGRLRYSELKRDIDGISQRMLTVTLRRLERDGLITRTVHPEVPPRVEYELTALGSSLLEAVQPLVAWTRHHRDDIAEARDRFDGQATS